MQSKNLKFKRRNINRSRKSQNAKQSRKLQIYRKNEIVYAKINESLHQNNNTKKKKFENAIKKRKKKKKKHKHSHTHTYTRNYKDTLKRKMMTIISIVKTITLIINNFIYVNSDKFSQT